MVPWYEVFGHTMNPMTGCYTESARALLYALSLEEAKRNARLVDVRPKDENSVILMGESLQEVTNKRKGIKKLMSILMRLGLPNISNRNLI